MVCKVLGPQAKILGPPRYLGPPTWGREELVPQNILPTVKVPLIFAIFHLTENQMKGEASIMDTWILAPLTEKNKQARSGPANENE